MMRRCNFGCAAVVVCILLCTLLRNTTSFRVSPNVGAGPRFMVKQPFRLHHSATARLSMMSVDATASQNSNDGSWSQAFLSSVRKQAPQFLRQVARVVGPFVLQLAIAVLFVNVAPAFAARSRKGSKTAVAAASAAAESAAMEAASAVVAKPPPLWRKLLEGASVNGAFKNFRAGDTRAEFAAILNSISSLLILGMFTFVAFVRHKQREINQNGRLKGELKKIDEYKENMYFEAVQEVLTKINDPKTKGSIKANLQKQLKDLDPEGTIQKFLESGGNRPDISHIINRKPKSKKKIGTVMDRPKKKSPSGGSNKRPTEQDTPSYADDEDEKDDKAGDDDDEDKNYPVDEPVKPTKPVRKTPAPAPAPAPAKKAAAPEDDDVYTSVLGELYESLDGAMSNASRGKLVENLKARIENISDPKKRESTVAKIAEMLGNDDYWIAYAKKIGA